MKNNDSRNFEYEEQYIDQKRADKSSIGTIVLCIIICIFNVLFLYGFFRYHLAQVPSASMEPALNVGDKYLVDQWAYKHKDPERYDIIIFLKDIGTQSDMYGKRIIGLPGEILEIRKGKIYINNNKYPIEDPYADFPRQEYLGPFRIPEDSYFVMGDNRQNSYDSRYWDDKFVKKETILGRAELVYYPRIKFL